MTAWSERLKKAASPIALLRPQAHYITIQRKPVPTVLQAAEFASYRLILLAAVFPTLQWRRAGSLLPDKSVLRALRTWKFKPGTVSRASVPIEFTREGENP